MVTSGGGLVSVSGQTLKKGKEQLLKPNNLNHRTKITTLKINSGPGDGTH